MSSNNALVSKWLYKDVVLPLYNAGTRLESGAIALKVIKAASNECVISIALSNGVESSYTGYNCHQALDEYRKELDAKNLIIGCMGAHYNFYVKRIDVRKSFGLEGVLTGKDGRAYLGRNNPHLPTAETFMASSDIDQLVTLRQQIDYRINCLNKRNYNL